MGLVCQSDFQSRGVARVDRSHQNAAAALRGTTRTWPCWMRSSQPTSTMAGVHRWRRWSRDGFWKPMTALFSPLILMPTSTSSSSASMGKFRTLADCWFIVCFSPPCKPALADQPREKLIHGSLNEGRSPHAYQPRNAFTSAATAAAIAECVASVGCSPSWVVPGFIATVPSLQ